MSGRGERSSSDAKGGLHLLQGRAMVTPVHRPEVPHAGHSEERREVTVRDLVDPQR